MKTKYEKDLEEFFDIEENSKGWQNFHEGHAEEEENYTRYFSEKDDFEDWKEFLQEHMGNEFQHLQNSGAAQNLNQSTEKILKEYDGMSLTISHEGYEQEIVGRFGFLKGVGVVEITSYTEPYEEDDKILQELYYVDEKGQMSWAYYNDFTYFAHNDAELLDNPIKFGDMVRLRDVPTSKFLELDTPMQEAYDLYINKVGLVTQIFEETNHYAIAFDREVVLIPMHLVDKLYKREIF